jgi:flagellar motor switch protein FliN
MDRDETMKWLADQLSGRLAEAVGGMAGKVPKVRVEPGPGPLADALWWQQSLSGIADAHLWLGAETDAWKRLGAEALAGAGIDDATDEDSRGTYLELIQQAISGVASAITARLGREILPKDGKLAPPTTGGHGVNLQVDLPGLDPIGPIALMWSSTIEDAVAAPPPAAPASAGQTASAPASSTAMTGPTGSGGADANDRYELLLDVEMPVSVSFGRAHLPLREIVKLTSGAIVELNRAVSEPVELIVNNCVVARGEVVVVDGNYGVRVKQIISRKERLRTLH